MAPPSAPHRRLAYMGAALGLVVLALLVPLPSPSTAAAPSRGGAFVWDRDSLWQGLEQSFVATRSAGCADSARVQADLGVLQALVDSLGIVRVPPDAPILDAIESRLFGVAPDLAACAISPDAFVTLQATLRTNVKRQSRAWDVDARATRERLYRVLYGSRAAVEEVVLQHPAGTSTLLRGTDEPSTAPGAVVEGVTVHSGDMLVSRGGYPTSALIARGNDFPGNFSHVALVHVDSATHAVSVIEAHIESGVAVSSAARYLADKKLRLLVLRPRADLPALVRDPMLPHRAASAMLSRARAGHVPYDFAMDYRDPSRLFCSEVASAAYHTQGVDLWTGVSTISSPGLRNWLGAFGVAHFETQEPSDLEYDPQLVVVAEWRDPALLYKDHIDNAVTDAMLEGAERGDRLGFAWYQLPLARLGKGYSWFKQQFGGIGPIPEGMSAASALRNKAYSARHEHLAHDVMRQASAWEAEHGYPPAYWTLVELARESIRQQSG
ncbi:MAG: YiiX/YebB-like N1pC/P60 family cysteine hydrolase [Gemmatimonadota bacterium]